METLTFEQECALYIDTEEEHRKRFERFTAYVNNDPLLDAHRTWVEKNIWGFGERPFHWLWKLLIDQMPDNRPFDFLEVGVFRGQVISLIRLLAERTGRAAFITGVTPLSSYSGERGEFPPHWESDYGADIRRIHDEFNAEFSMSQIVKGLSTDAAVIDQVKRLDSPFDIVYIDGCHEYWAVKSDLRHYPLMVKPGGFLVVDDASCHLKMWWGSFPGIEQVARALDEEIVGHPGWRHCLAVGHLRVFQKEK